MADVTNFPADGPGATDALTTLAEVEALLHRSRGLGARAVVDRHAALGRLASARDLFGAELREARDVLRDRDAIIEEGRQAAEQLRAEARADRTRQLTGSEAGEEARRVLAEATDFAERSLAELEVVLQRVLSSITRARTQLDKEGSPIGADALHTALHDDE